MRPTRCSYLVLCVLFRISLTVAVVVRYNTPMSNHNRKMTIEELAQDVGVSVRTVRFYITEGLIPGPGTRGKSAAYGQEHLLRLQLVRRLSEQHVPLADIRRQLAGLSLDEVRVLLQEEEIRDAELQRAAQDLSPKEYVSALLDRARAGHRPPSSPWPGSSQQLQSPPLRARDQEVFSPESPPVRDGETWQRQELAPGIELHVRSDIEARYRGLIDRLLRLVDEAGENAGSQ